MARSSRTSDACRQGSGRSASKAYPRIRRICPDGHCRRARRGGASAPFHHSRRRTEADASSPRSAASRAVSQEGTLSMTSFRRAAIRFAAPGLLMTALTATASAANAANWKLDSGKSKLGFSGTQTGTKFQGAFTRYNAAIEFDPDHLDTSHIAVSVDLASATTNDKQRDAALPGKDWFDCRAISNGEVRDQRHPSKRHRRLRGRGNTDSSRCHQAAHAPVHFGDEWNIRPREGTCRADPRCFRDWSRSLDHRPVGGA